MVIQVNVNLERQKRIADELLKVRKALPNERGGAMMSNWFLGTLKITMGLGDLCSEENKRSKLSGD